VLAYYYYCSTKLLRRRIISGLASKALVVTSRSNNNIVLAVDGDKKGVSPVCVRVSCVVSCTTSVCLFHLWCSTAQQVADNR
jgi:hypothetical protein